MTEGIRRSRWLNIKSVVYDLFLLNDPRTHSYDIVIETIRTEFFRMQNKFG